MPHVVAVPHIGSATDEARTAMARIAAEDVARFLRGEKPVNVVTDTNKPETRNQKPEAET